MDWSDGAYEHTATVLEPATRALLDVAQVQPGMRVLDVGCGTGNAALEAARRGALVSAIDPAARLIEVTRERARGEGLTVDAQLGEGATLPFADASFDRLLSVFAVIFAPDPPSAAREMRRVTRQGGSIVLSAWLAEGALFEAGRLLWSAVPAPPDAARTAPPAWGQPEFVQGLFPGARLVSHEHALAFEDASAGAWFEEQEAHHPMWRGVRKMLAKLPGAWDRVRDDTVALLERQNEATTGFRVTSKYRIHQISL